MFNPFFVQPQQYLTFWKLAVDAQLGRLDAMAGEAQKLEEQCDARAAEAIDEAAKLWKASFRYGRELQSGMRQMALELVKQGASATTAGV